MSDDTANAGTLPWRLTEDVETACGPKLADPFVDHLDALCGTTDLTDAQRLRAALARLERERPELHAAVVLMDQPRATVRSVAPILGVSPKTVCLRRHRALDKLRQWCHSDAEQHAHVA